MPFDFLLSRRRPGLRGLLTLAALLLSMLVCGTLALLRTTQLEDDAQAAAGALNLQQALGVAAAVDADLGRFGRELLAQARLVERLELLEQPARLQVLLEGVFAAPSFAWAGVTNGRGRVLAALDGRLVGMDVSQRDWWGAGRNGLHYGDLHEAQLLARLLPELHSGEPWRFVDVAAPLRDTANGSTGVLAVHLSWPWLRERIALYAAAAPARQAQLFIAGRDGRQRLGPAGAVGQPLPVQPLAAQEPQGWRVLQWSDGQRYVTAWAPFRGSPPYAGMGWTAVVRTPLQALHEAGAPERRWVWGAAALGVAGATALAWLLSTLLLVPLVAARAQAQRASEAKDRFLATMSHELRTPLNGLLGHAQLLQARLKDEDNRANAERILSTGEQLLRILNEVLDLGRIESGHLVLQHQPLRVEAVLQGCHELFAPAAAAKGLDLVLELPATPLPWLLGDAARLQQVLSNLVANALKFTAQGGVTLALACDGVAADGRLALRIEVRDSGIGLSEAQRRRLFEPFAQAEDSTAQRYGGSGLGLWISRRLVQAMNGDIEVESEPGRGTLVRLRLALERTPAGADTGAAVGAPPPVGGAVAADAERTLRVLVADDVAINREVLRALVQHQGHAVEEVADGLSAVRRVAEGGIDLVLMDVEMPDIDGLEAARRIRALPGAEGRVPLWAVTGRAYEHDVAQVRAAGMDGHLSKPVSIAALAELLRAVAAAQAQPEGAE
ncbi:hybrid sensor histidine kinase/response regulator [Azohydromonas aeria]|uniref:hybrid sensor histidine kinase/response regulator n=1 Tax=Azohydromonas aeria TaxID=2590212 RepID=UPI0012F881F0|nr:hybrid sensor histidine kinase/response regulator [Azohydromonas aeria]